MAVMHESVSGSYPEAKFERRVHGDQFEQLTGKSRPKAEVAVAP
jgi:hypothetical protein